MREGEREWEGGESKGVLGRVRGSGREGGRGSGRER